jgi:hypothetical protein
MRAFGFEGLGLHSSLIFIPVGLITQRGSYEIISIAMPLTHIFFLRLVVRMLLNIFTFSYGIYKDRVSDLRRILNVIQGIHHLLSLSLGIASALTCHGEAATFDTMFLSVVMIHYIVVDIVALITLKFTNEFLRNLKKQHVNGTPENESEVLDDVCRRINILKYNWVVCLGVLSLSSLSAMLVRAILSSFPYLFAIYMTLVYLAQLMILGVVAIFPVTLPTARTSNHGTTTPRSPG